MKMPKAKLLSGKHRIQRKGLTIRNLAEIADTVLLQAFDVELAVALIANHDSVWSEATFLVVWTLTECANAERHLRLTVQLPARCNWTSVTIQS